MRAVASTVKLLRALEAFGPKERMMEHHTAPGGQHPLPSVPGTEVWRLLAPWLGYLVITLAAIVGLFAAAGLADPADRSAGVLCFFLAAALIAWRIHRQTGGEEDGFFLRLAIRSSDELLRAVAIFAVLGVCGLLAATAGEGVFRSCGVAFFICCVGLIFFHMKGYFDYRDGGSGH
jgi:uncharacterized membrane protein